MENPATRSGINRRKSLRRKPRGSVKVECRAGSYGLGKNLTSAVLDLSDTGARLILTEELEPASEVELIISSYGVSKPIKRLGVVRWQVKLEDGRFCIGAELQKRLDYRDWQNLSCPN
ncbi:MAG: PilZ domain-containing protein [Planctomycetes bacterium]|nr:PilZ domain-containing protein [Planctomycetota bacterium]